MPRPEADGTGARGSVEIRGWLEVVSWPGLESVQRHRGTEITDRQASLDPNGQLLAYSSYDEAQQQFVNVVDLSSGHSDRFAVQHWPFAWNGSGQVVLAPRGGEAEIRDARRRLVIQLAVRGSYVAASADGSTIVFSDERTGGRRSFVRMLLGGQIVEGTPLPADGYTMGYCGQPSVAPDGGGLVVVCSYHRSSSTDGDHEVAALSIGSADALERCTSG